MLGVTIALATGWIGDFGSPGYFQAAAGSLSAVAPLLAIVLAAFIHAADLQNGACRMLTARGDSRDSVLAAKALLGIILLLAFHLTVLALAAVIALVLEPHFKGWRTGLEAGAASLVASLLYLSLGILLAHWRQSSAFTVGVGLAVVFAENIFYPIANGLGEFLRWPVDAVTAWTLWGITQGLQGDIEFLGPVWYLPIALGYIAVLTGLSLLAFRKLDLKAGGE